MRKKILQPVLILFISSLVHAQKSKSFNITSPDGNIQLKVGAGSKLQWSVTHQSQAIIAPSSISLKLQSGEVLGDNAQITSSKNEKVNNKIAALNYKKDTRSEERRVGKECR